MVVDESGGVAVPGAGAIELSAGGVDASGAAAGGAIVLESAGGAVSVAFCFEHAAVTASTPRQRKTALRFMETSESGVRFNNVLRAESFHQTSGIRFRRLGPPGGYFFLAFFAARFFALAGSFGRLFPKDPA